MVRERGKKERDNAMATVKKTEKKTFCGNRRSKKDRMNSKE